MPRKLECTINGSACSVYSSYTLVNLEAMMMSCLLCGHEVLFTDNPQHLVVEHECDNYLPMEAPKNSMDLYEFFDSDKEAIELIKFLIKKLEEKRGIKNGN
jgi:hypothetical protein